MEENMPARSPELAPLHSTSAQPSLRPYPNIRFADGSFRRNPTHADVVTYWVHGNRLIFTASWNFQETVIGVVAWFDNDLVVCDRFATQDASASTSVSFQIFAAPIPASVLERNAEAALPTETVDVAGAHDIGKKREAEVYTSKKA